MTLFKPHIKGLLALSYPDPQGLYHPARTGLQSLVPQAGQSNPGAVPFHLHSFPRRTRPVGGVPSLRFHSAQTGYVREEDWLDIAHLRLGEEPPDWW